MARVNIYQPGSIQRAGTTGANFRAADFSASPIAEGLKAAGEGLADFAKKQDEIEDIKARVEANRLAVEHSEHSRMIGRRVKQTLGEGAESAADQGITELQKATKDILGRASPRARVLLESEFGQRNVVAHDSFLDHGFGEKVKAFGTSSEARLARTVEDAADEEDEARALELLKPVFGINAERSRFFGNGSDWEKLENTRVVSGFFKSRALKLAVGESGSAHAAIEYATKNRQFLSDGDYNAIVSAYNDNALDELAASLVDGAPFPSATTFAQEPTEGGQQSRFLDPIAFFKGFTVPHEGRAYVTDSNGRGVKFGINEAHNPGVDVKNLTEARAAQIFKTKYFEKSGADKLPPALAAVHVDTFFLNEKEAGRILKQSGGDVDKYIELRRSFLNGLATRNPAKFGRYKKGWENRTKALAEFADRQGTDGRPVITPDANIEQGRAAIMARTDIGLALKTKLVNRLEQRRAEVRQERAIVEEEASRDLTEAVIGLGDNFTDVKQLPQSAWLQASPAVRQSLTEAAKQKVESKPLTPELAAYITYVQVADPHKFASPAFRQELIAKGVPLTKVREVAAAAGQMAGALATAKPNVATDGTLWGIAKPAFEQAGIFFDTIEAEDKEDKLPERQADAAAKEQALRALRDTAAYWAMNNPGKQPDEATIRGWVGNALLRPIQGQRFYQVGDQELINSISPADYNRIWGDLRAAGASPTPELIAKVYRREFLTRRPDIMPVRR